MANCYATYGFVWRWQVYMKRGQQTGGPSVLCVRFRSAEPHLPSHWSRRASAEIDGYQGSSEKRASVALVGCFSLCLSTTISVGQLQEVTGSVEF